MYKFRNIRYAQPPVGDLRFAAPLSPTGTSKQVENGSVTRTCPQATPIWGYVAVLFEAYIEAGDPTAFNYTAAEEEVVDYLASLPSSQPDASEMEDCLFLDVYVPKDVFDNTQEKAPVIVW